MENLSLYENLNLALNDLTPELQYKDYKELYEFINGNKTINKLYAIVTGFTWDDFENFEAAEYLQQYFESLVNRLHYGFLAKDYDESDSHNPYMYGYTIGKYIFITNYTGIAGKYWNTICY